MVRALQSTARGRKGKACLTPALRGSVPGPRHPEQPLQLRSSTWKGDASFLRGTGPQGVCAPHLTLRRQSEPERHDICHPFPDLPVLRGVEGGREGGQSSSEEVGDSKVGTPVTWLPQSPGNEESGWLGYGDT